MYSLMLAEDVIREVDRLAAENRTNRSNLVNQILAEYVSLVTPEMHIRNIFDAVESLIGDPRFATKWRCTARPRVR